MTTAQKFKSLFDHPNLEVLDRMVQSGSRNILLKGLAGSSKAIFCARYFEQQKRSFLVILNDKESAAYFYNDLRNLLGDNRVFFFPSSYKRSVQYQQSDPSNVVIRTEILNMLAAKTRKSVVVSYPESLMEKVPDGKSVKDHTFHLNEGELVNISFVEEVLREYGFSQTDFVYEPGQYAIRGSILDIFSYSSEFPFRVDFFGNEIESIRTFSVDTQLSIETHKKVSILPDLIGLSQAENSGSFFRSFPKSTLVWYDNLEFSTSRINDIYHQTDIKASAELDSFQNPVPDISHWLITGHQFEHDIRSFIHIGFHQYQDGRPVSKIDFHTSPQPAFNKNFELLTTNLSENMNLGYSNFILTENEKQIERLNAIFNDIDQSVRFTPIQITLHEGFIDHQMKLCCYTDHQIFERYHKFHLRGHFTKKEVLTVRELTGLNPGDYIVHIDHGIGRFGGLEKIEVQGKTQEAIKLVYKDQDTLYVSIHALHRISKYKGKDLEPPRIYKLGSNAWQNLKNKTKKKVQDIARELISLYAQRKARAGFSFSPDSYLQNELEASFLYEDTPDQLMATNVVKQGMEASYPMDTLVCGDVGFGKTEVAIRAAFKAVTDSKQVAVLVPTTILALQHYNTFRDRLKDFPCSVDYINRFRQPAQQKKILKRLSDGSLDIIIGTHRLVSKDVQFKNLGLLVIDEEQKFGVAVKEKIRQLKTDVDTLTLTATPIPRTLQFSLMGARDLSIIRTPPPNRHPIITESYRFNESIIKEGIEYEISRGGQVFFIHNRVEHIEEIQKILKRILPMVRTVIVHGQMEGKKLEAAMLDFINGEYDVLIATTIIESGLDIPNANTIFINNAHQFGLSDLHQLRGRVGRSNKKAFCYLLAPPPELVSPEARRRLTAIEEFSDLGSGFNIAMQDLDIRGAGNLLGAEQSGFIAEMGLETYQRILQEAIQELRETEFKDTFQPQYGDDTASADHNYVTDVYFETDLELLIPDEYVENISERLRLYRDLDMITSEADLARFQKNLEDRFGPVPESTLELMDIVRIREHVKRLGIEKIVLKKNTLVFYFISDSDSTFYQSPAFGRILSAIQKNPRRYQMKEANGKLRLSVKGIKSVSGTKNIVSELDKKD